jgi:hypothetical protein
MPRTPDIGSYLDQNHIEMPFDQFDPNAREVQAEHLMEAAYTPPLAKPVVGRHSPWEQAWRANPDPTIPLQPHAAFGTPIVPPEDPLFLPDRLWGSTRGVKPQPVPWGEKPDVELAPEGTAGDPHKALINAIEWYLKGI